VIEGGAGNDTMNGSGGIDTVSYASAASAVTVNLATATGQNTLGAGTDTLSSFEWLIGSGFNDTLTGSTAANNIYGGAGNDTIQGGNGNDILYGGAGTDTLTGGANADTFVFEAASAFANQDTITDFSTANADKIDLHDILDVAFDPVNDAISDFVRITDNGTHSFLSVDADGGGNSFTQIAQLSSVTNIAAGATATELELQAMITNGTLLAA
jgi:Ca2+-binding RTX toxin-like protein